MTAVDPEPTEPTEIATKRACWLRSIERWQDIAREDEGDLREDLATMRRTAVLASESSMFDELHDCHQALVEEHPRWWRRVVLRQDAGQHSTQEWQA